MVMKLLIYLLIYLITLCIKKYIVHVMIHYTVKYPEKKETKWQGDLKETRKLDGLIDQVSKNAIKSMMEETA